MPSLLNLAAPPADDFLAVYADIIFDYHAFLSTQREVALEVELYTYDDDTAAFVKHVTATFPPTGSLNNGSTKTFRVNASELLQDWFTNSDTLLPRGQAINAADNRWSCLFFLRAKLWRTNGADTYLSYDGESTIDSQQYVAINAVRQPYESPSLFEYSRVGDPVTGLRKFLTKAPYYKACPDDSIRLSIVNNGLSMVASFIAFDSAGNPIYLNWITTPLPDREGVTQIGIGPADLQYLNWSVAWAGIPAGTASYQIAYGALENYSEVMRVILLDKCCATYRIHFLNSFGQIDSFSVQANDLVRKETTSERFEQAMPYYTGYADDYLSSLASAGGFRHAYKQVQDIIELDIQRLDTNEVAWLSEELLGSPLVWLEEEDRFFPVLVKDKTHTIKDREQRVRRLRFDVIRAIEHFSQRN